MKTTLNYLFHADPPWISVGLAEPARKRWTPQHFYTHPGIDVCVRRLRGAKMRTTPALMDEIGASLQFFEGFGENWVALGDCLKSLDEWMPAAAYVLVIESAEEILTNEEANQMEALLKTLHEAGEWWSKPITDNDRFNRCDIPFHVLLNLTDADAVAAERIAGIANGAGIPIRR